MTGAGIGRLLIGAAAVATILVPIGVDGAALARGHMRNPGWPAHAKLHCAMSFFAAVALGGGSLALLWTRPAGDAAGMAIAAFLGTAFWAGLIAAGRWPGAAYGFPDEPGIVPDAPRVAGLPLNLNVVFAIVALGIGWAGFALTLAGG